MHACIYFSGVYIYIFIFQDIPNICACMGKNVSFVVEIISCYDAKISKNKLRNLHCVSQVYTNLTLPCKKAVLTNFFTLEGWLQYATTALIRVLKFEFELIKRTFQGENGKETKC